MKAMSEDIFRRCNYGFKRSGCLFFNDAATEDGWGGASGCRCGWLKETSLSEVAHDERH